MALQGPLRSRGGIVPPGGKHEGVHGNDLATLDEQRGEYPAGDRAAECEGLTTPVASYLRRAEQAETHALKVGPLTWANEGVDQSATWLQAAASDLQAIGDQSPGSRRGSPSTAKEFIMTLDTRPTVAPSAETSTTPETSRRHVFVVAGISLGAVVLAIAGGVLVGNQLTGGSSQVGPGVGKPVVFPQDWQQFRSGERTTTIPTTPGSEQQSFRAGERATGASDSQSYRAGERANGLTVVHPSDWLSYRAGEH